MTVPVQQAHLVLGTVRRFCQSDDAAIGRDHVPRYGRLLGLPDELLAQIQGWAVGQAAALWVRMIDRRDDVPLGHDGYLKLWALGRPSLPAEYILLDEAQDTNAVVLGVLKHQDAQIVYVGDRHQQIYEWRGALNAMEQVVGCEEAALTQSFRFGDAIHSQAHAHSQKGPLSPGYPPLSNPLKRKGLETVKRAGQNVRVRTYGRKRRTTRRGPPSPPSRSEGAAMIFDHARKLYLENPDAAPMAEAMLDATFTALAGIADDARRHALVRRAFELAYDELGQP